MNADRQDTAAPAAGRAAPLTVVIAVCVLFFVSGSVGLIYQVAWRHLFTTVFGSTTYALSVLLAVFMTGLALGSHVFGRVADRSKRHLLIFSGLQAGIAVSAALVPTVLRLAESAYTAIYSATGSPALLLLAQIAASAAVVLVPTFLMGGTLPVLTSYLARRDAQVARVVGLLYGVNTLGAACGAFLAGFVVLKVLGTALTIYAASAVNAGLVLVFLLLQLTGGRQAGPAAEEQTVEPGGRTLSAGRLRLLLLAVGISGFVSFSYEVLWTRLLTFRFQTTVYAFSTMLTTFLLGLGLGGAIVGLIRRRWGRADYWRLFGWLQAGVGILGFGTILLFSGSVGKYGSFAERALTEFGVSAMIMILPTTLLGAAFPIACHLFARSAREAGRSVGGIYVVNTIGAVAGALLTGFVLIRLRPLGTQGTLSLASFLMVASGAAVLAFAPRREGAELRSARILAAPAALCLAAVAVWAAIPGGFLRNYFLENQYIVKVGGYENVDLLAFEEGVEGIVCVCELPTGDRTISTGSTDVAGTLFTLRNTQKLQAHVPMLLHPNPKSVCQIGFGSGETAHLFTTYDLDRFDVVEISQGVLDMADAHFRSINKGVLESGKCNAIVMDGSTYLKHTARKYDVIANDSIWPHLAGNSALYTREYFQNGHDHLNPGGIMTSWLPIEMPLVDFKILLKTFHSVFPHVYIWTAASHPNKHALLVGSDQPLRIDAGRYMERFNRYARQDLEEVHLGDPAEFLACHRATMRTMDIDLDGLPLNTEDLPILQYLGSRPESSSASRRRDLVAGCLRLISAHPDPVAARLVDTDALPDAAAFMSRLKVADEATAHLVRGFGLRSVDDAGAAREFQLARVMMPDHPAFVAAREEMAQPSASPRPAVDLASAELPEVEKEAYRLLQEGAFAGALAAFQEWSRREPEADEPVARAGVCYLSMGNASAAAALFEAAIRLNERNATAHFGMGLAYLRAGDTPAAVPYLRRAAELDPDMAGAHARLGSALAALGQMDAALSHLQRAAELEPSRPDVCAELAALLAARGDFAAAVAPLKALTHIRPDLPDGYRRLADVYERLGDAGLAARYAERARELTAEATPPAPPLGLTP